MMDGSKNNRISNLKKASITVILLGLIFIIYNVSILPNGKTQDGIKIAKVEKLEKKGDRYYSKGIFGKRFVGLVEFENRREYSNFDGTLEELPRVIKEFDNYKFLNKNGEIVHEYIEWIEDVKKEKFIIKNNRDQYGVIRENGDIILPFIYWKIESADQDDQYIVQNIHGKVGIVDEKQNFIIPIEYLAITRLDSNGFYKATKKMYEDEIINKDGEVLIPSIYGSIEGPNRDNNYKFFRNGVGLIDRNGKVLFRIENKERMSIKEISEMDENKNYMVVFDETEGGILTHYYPFSTTKTFTVDLGPVRTTRVHSLINNEGKELDTSRRSRIWEADVNGNYFVSSRERIVDKNGKTLIGGVKNFRISKKDGSYIVKGGVFTGITDKLGNIIIPMIYDEIEELDENENHIAVDRNGKFGIIDKSGNIIMPFRYSKIITGKNRNEYEITDESGTKVYEKNGDFYQVKK